MTVKLVSWNIAKRRKAWEWLLEMDADVAILQEVGVVPGWVASREGVAIGPREHWDSHVWLADAGHLRRKRWFDRWPMVVKLSDRFHVEWFKLVAPVAQPRDDEFPASGIGTVAAARIVPADSDREAFIAVSMYGRWIRRIVKPRRIYPDGSVHRIISDLSAFVNPYDPKADRILAAGDLNVAFRNSDPFNPRAQTILDRMQALGLEYAGPEYPHGRRADPVPSHLTEASLDVPTYHTTRRTPATAHVQLDHVFASRGFHQTVRTWALNDVPDWGPSDHCRILIEVGAD